MDLSPHEIEELHRDAVAADRQMNRVGPGWTALAPRMRRLLDEMRSLREQAGERERMHAEEVAW